MAVSGKKAPPVRGFYFQNIIAATERKSKIRETIQE